MKTKNSLGIDIYYPLAQLKNHDVFNLFFKPKNILNHNNSRLCQFQMLERYWDMLLTVLQKMEKREKLDAVFKERESRRKETQMK